MCDCTTVRLYDCVVADSGMDVKESHSGIRTANVSGCGLAIVRTINRMSVRCWHGRIEVVGGQIGFEVP